MSYKSLLSPKTGSRKSKGLSYYTGKIIAKIQGSSGITAADLTAQLTEEQIGQPESVLKNLKRRVYDAINVLLGAGVIIKDDKTSLLHWKDIANKRDESSSKPPSGPMFSTRIALKRLELARLKEIEQSLEWLAQRNARQEQVYAHSEKIRFPFILLASEKDVEIGCEMSYDLTRATFTYNGPFDLLDERACLEKLINLQSHPVHNSVKLPR